MNKKERSVLAEIRGRTERGVSWWPTPHVRPIVAKLCAEGLIKNVGSGGGYRAVTTPAA